MKDTLLSLLDAIHGANPDTTFEVVFWDGVQTKFGQGEPLFRAYVNSAEALRRLLAAGSLGFADGYIDGDITVEGDLYALLRLGVDPRFQARKLSLRTRLQALRHAFLTRNTLRGARRNIRHHYDLGNDFYKLWLDESMTYSCAYFETPEDALEEAQAQKHDHICRKLRLQPGETLIDIGCGWGGMLIHAAQHYGVRGVGCTLSDLQVIHAQEHIRELGLEDRIEVRNQDYRKLKGTFDKFVSIGMFEHVGRRYIPGFMRKVRGLLKPGGTGLLHTIGIEHVKWSGGWVNKYIFPGGYLPQLGEISNSLGDVELTVHDVENLRFHYALTLEEWARRYEEHAGEVEAMFDGAFVRKWRLFLNGAAAGFRYGRLRLYQVLFANGLEADIPLTRRYMYPAKTRAETAETPSMP